LHAVGPPIGDAAPPPSAEGGEAAASVKDEDVEPNEEEEEEENEEERYAGRVSRGADTAARSSWSGIPMVVRAGGGGAPRLPGGAETLGGGDRELAMAIIAERRGAALAWRWG
jgi:hypothetical protein